MANLSHCPLSRCQTQPGYCEMKASDEDFLGLLFIILLPIFIAVFAPGIARGGVPCRSDDDTPHLRTRDIRGIDPPMFLCGIGLIPLDCGLSGLLTVAFAMGSGFAVLFFAMLTSARPRALAVFSVASPFQRLEDTRAVADEARWLLHRLPLEFA